ncbi:leucine-rich repeat-containing protein 9-like isoform X2 [Pomacea canaliculata]|uniref:leucine-rich repeat-containing protein 9-like isoform X2 n=1 Tax=Pomacea canaliculata TaxID=400727 RepID=UPI000D726332|nr:leucine-rich repeat-containing protein 9-like isoform X2 [Pomacea canaliculata]
MSAASSPEATTSSSLSSLTPSTFRKEPQLSALSGENVSEASPPLSSKSNDEDILKEVCLNNGVTYTKISEEGPSVDVLEMFFSGFSRIIGMHHFPNIHTLTIIGQSISQIVGLTPLSKLRELWVAECQKIEGLEECTKLQKLYLYGNKIEAIENLDNLLLEVLWLNGNAIKNIENLSHLQQLRELNLAENIISKIGHALNSNIYIEDLNLSGNPISSLRDVTNLMRLPNLKSLSFKDPLYQPSPVATLCNYSAHILFHLPSLCRLDTYDVTSKNLKDLAQSTVLKKKMYYNMRTKTVKRNMASLLQKMERHKELDVLMIPYQRLRTLTYAIKEIEREIEECERTLCQTADVHDSDTESERDAHEQFKTGDRSMSRAFQTKLTLLNERKAHWERKCSEVEEVFKEAKQRLQQKADTIINRLEIELETGGNVRFEEGTPEDLWFTSCRDLVMSRFCAKDFLSHDIIGVTIHKIIRIQNRILRERFDKQFLRNTNELAKYCRGKKNTNYKRLLEYLFWIWDPDMPGGWNEPARVPEEGFMDAESYKMLGRPAAVPLSNSLYLADRHRIASTIKYQREHGNNDPCPFRFGQMVVSKTYLGKSMKFLNKPVATEYYPAIDTIFKSWLSCFPHKEENFCECRQRQCEWYVFNHEFVLPEYIIEFEYITKESPEFPFISLPEKLSGNKMSDILLMSPKTVDDISDSVVLNMEPEVPHQNRIVSMTEEQLLKMGPAHILSAITYLNLHGNGLSKMKGIQSLTSLKKLIVSFNELTTLEDISQMDLEYLDASYNNIVTLEGMKSVNLLSHLDLSWNKLQNSERTLTILFRNSAAVSHLDLRHNLWKKPEALHFRLIGNLKKLVWLNGESVGENEVNIALRQSAGSCLSQLLVLGNSRADTSLPRSLVLGSGAHIIMQVSRLKPEKVSEADNSWYSLVTTLKLDGLHITKLCNLDLLENLRWASFDNNDLTKIEGLDNCTMLEDLSLDNNRIVEIRGLLKLTRLCRLSLVNNELSSVDAEVMACLPNLTFLALDKNFLTLMAGLQHAQSLVELYISNNLIKNIHEIFFLKNLVRLVILDMYGNPVSREMENCRLFIIFHLRMLKALDGDAIEAHEGIASREAFGGRLTLDFVAEKVGHTTFEDVQELDFPNFGIRAVDLGPAGRFMNLRSLNLENNNLTSFNGLTNLLNLRVLCVNNNHIECIVPRMKATTIKSRPTPGNTNKVAVDLNAETLTPLLERLEVLHLGNNGIKDMAALQLGRLPSLKALFLQGNEITKVEGLERLHDLRELVLDRNKIKAVSEFSFASQWNLQELHIEENRLREVGGLNLLENLKRLYLGSNRIHDPADLEKLETLYNLRDISLINNPVTRRLMHRVVLIHHLPNLLVIDGITVTEDEQYRTETCYSDQSLATQTEPSLPGIPPNPIYKNSVPVKVTTVQLCSSPLWPPYCFDDNEVMQRGAGRRRVQPRSEISRTVTCQNLNSAVGNNSSLQNNSSRTGGSSNSYHFVGHIAPNQTSEYIAQIARLQQQRLNKR